MPWFGVRCDRTRRALCDPGPRTEVRVKNRINFRLEDPKFVLLGELFKAVEGLPSAPEAEQKASGTSGGGAR